MIAMLRKFPQYNEYWQDKRAKIEQVEVPAYVLASYSTFLHTFGSFRGFEGMQNSNKWFECHVAALLYRLANRTHRLRVHATQEWHDLYQSSTNDELQRFLDHFAKGIDNDWDQTPKVRASILRFNEVGQPDRRFPRIS